ncbi:MAG TPA: PaaI family thioesterase [Paracoccaceae bacterium]|nr:PaaI family thioesterase [Paracoccaceae bacterium]
MDLRSKLDASEYRGGIAFRIEEKSPEKVVAKMPVGPDMLNPFGTVHAGAMIWFADIAATICAIGDAAVEATGRGFPLAIDLHAVLVANRRDGELTATARPVRRGSQLTVIRTEVTDADGRLLIDVTTSHVPAR